MALLDEVLNRSAAYKPFMEEDEIRLTVSIVQNLICVPTKTGKRCDEAQAKKFIALCKARKLNPFAGDAYLIGYDSKDGPTFSLITAHQAFLKRAEVHPEFDGFESGVIVQTPAGDVLDREGDFVFDNETLLGGWAVVFFKNRKHPMKRRPKLSTYQKCYDGKPYGRWKDDPAGMIVKVAEADALRSSFPTLLGGMYLEDEMPAPAVVHDEPKQLPRGRQYLRNGTHREPAQIQAPEAAPLEAETASGEAIEREPGVEEEQATPQANQQESIDREATAREIEEAIEQAGSVQVLQAIGGKIMNGQQEWGEDWGKELMLKYRAKFKALAGNKPQRARASDL